MLQLLGAMLAVIATWCFLAVIFVGLGKLFCRLVGIASERTDSLFSCFWLGWAATIMFLQLWHLKFKVDGYAFAIVATLGLLGIAISTASLRRIFPAIRSANRKTTYGIAAAMCFAILFWSSLALGTPRVGDTGLYHMTSVRWASAYPIVPGLGNLHARLAFNNSSFLYDAMLDFGPWAEKSHHLANSLLSLMVILQILSAVPKALLPNTRGWVRYLFQVLLLPVVVLLGYKSAVNFSPDMVTFLIGTVVSIQLLDLLIDRQGDARQRNYVAFVICFLSTVGLTVKLSFLPFGFAASVIALLVLHFRTPETDRGWRQYKTAMFASLFASLIIVTWSVRGVLLSGYVAFPSTIGDVDVPWRVPTELADSTRNWIYAWGRKPWTQPEEVLGNWNWVGGWIVNNAGNMLELTIPLCCALVGLVTAVKNFKRLRDRNEDHLSASWLILLPAVLTIGFVLVTVPLVRFAGVSIWVLGAGAIALSLNQMDRSSEIFRKRLRFTLRFSAILLLIVIIKASRYTNGPTAEGGLRPLPVAEYRQKETDSGLIVIVPVEKPRNYALWSAPLPNAPYFRSELSLRRQGDLSSGFIMQPKKEKPTADVAGEDKKETQRR